MKTNHFLFFILMLGVFSSCQREIYCPGLPEDLATYFPYTKGQMLVFTNSKGETAKYEITDYHKITEDRYYRV